MQSAGWESVHVQDALPVRQDTVRSARARTGIQNRTGFLPLTVMAAVLTGCSDDGSDLDGCGARQQGQDHWPDPVAQVVGSAQYNTT